MATLKEVVSLPEYPESSPQEIYDDLFLPTDVPTSSVDVVAVTIMAEMAVSELTAWRTHPDPDVVSSWEAFRLLASGNSTIRGDRLIEQASILLGLGVIAQETFDAVDGLIITTRPKWQAEGLSVEPVLWRIENLRI